MIRALFLLIVSFISITTFGQKPFKYAGRGIQMTEMWADSVARIPSDTVRNKTGIARIGVRFFVGNGTFWTEIAGGSSAPSGLSGAVVTQIDSTRFNVSPGSYYIQGSLYANGDTTFNLSQPGDTSRIDVIGLDTTGNVFTITGVESENPYPSSIDPLSQIYLSFVWVDTDTVYFAPTPVNYWSALGNDIINNNPGKVQFTNGLYVDQITANDSRLYTSRQLVLQSNKNTGVRILAGRVGGNVDLNTTELQLSLGDNSTTGTAKTALSLTGRSLHASGSEAMNMLSITPTISQSGSYTGTVRGIYYNPTVTANVGTHYAFESTLGRIKFGGMETGDTTTYKPLGIDASGNIRKIASWPAGGGGGGVGTLQQVTDLGAVSTNAIDVNGITTSGIAVNGDILAASGNANLKSLNVTNYSLIDTLESELLVSDGIKTRSLASFEIKSSQDSDDGISLSMSDMEGYASLIFEDLASSQNYRFPNESGTIALAENVVSNVSLTDSLNVLRDSLQVLRDSLAAYMAEDTVYTTSGIETVYGGDSTTIRLPYKSYVAIIDIDGTATDPTVIVLQNDLDSLPVWTRTDAGIFHCNATGMFTANKTIIPNIGMSDDLAGRSSGFHILADDAASITGIGRFTNPSTSQIRLYTLDTSTGVNTDIALSKFAVEIRVFY